VLAHYAYTLDAAGNRTHVTETGSGVPRGISYTYDALYRLTAADYSTGEQYAYQYDPVGNRTAMTDTAVHTYVYDAANRLTSADGVLYTWDGRGNLLSDGTFTYTYNSAGRMVRAQSLTATLVYTYNADGLRLARSQSVTSVQSVDTFTWDWATGVPELLSDGDSLYLIGYDTLGWQSGTAWTFVLPDALGSVRQETDAAGAVTAAREWSPYGEEIGEAQTGLGFTGEWFDAGVGLTYLRARWYDGATGRFTQVDPWSGDVRQPHTLHKFNYVGGNPINKNDPSGLAEIIPWDTYRQLLLIAWTATSKPLDIGTNELTGIADPDPKVAYMARLIVALNFQESPISPSHPNNILNDMQCYENPSYEQIKGIDYNKYDWIISGWTSYWNWRKQRSGSAANLPNVSPNLIKAIAFEETGVGQSEAPGDIGNVMQVRDGFVTFRDLEGLKAMQGTYVDPYAWGFINVGSEFQGEPFDTIAYGIRFFFYKMQMQSILNGGFTDSESDWQAALDRYGPGNDTAQAYGWRVWELYSNGWNSRDLKNCDWRNHKCEDYSDVGRLFTPGK